jgi:[protein-PII] uridylyltransferase
MMPPFYWERVTEADLIWGLETIHGFLKLIASPQVLATAPFVSWRQTDQPSGARVMLCTWNRHGLLAKAAAAFSAVRLNIVSAQVFTRADNIVLDEFFVTNGDGRTTVNEVRMQEMTFLLEGALSEPPRFASVWACSRHKLLATRSAVVPRVTFDNDSSEESTVVQVVAADRLGLLYDILQALADAGLNIKQAHIETDNDLARDTIHVTDARGEKLDPNAFDLLRHKLQTALSLPD